MINDVMTLDPGPESLSRTKFQVLSCRCVKIDQFYRFPPIHDLPAAGMLSSVLWEGVRTKLRLPELTQRSPMTHQMGI